MMFPEWLTEDMCVKIIYFWIGFIVLLFVIVVWLANRNWSAKIDEERKAEIMAQQEEERKRKILEEEERDARIRKEEAEIKEHPYSWREKHEDPVRLSDRELVWAGRYIHKVHYDSDRLEELTAEVEKRIRQEQLIEAVNDIRRKL